MNPEQADFLRAPRRTLLAAHDLFRLGHLPEAATRAYYAMFYAAQAFLEEEGLRSSRHAEVISAFGRVFAKTGRVPPQLHRSLIDAQEERLRADYDMAASVPSERVEQHLNNAERFLAVAEQMLGQP